MQKINIGKTIVRKRKEKGITQEELANFIGVSKASVSKWETGHSYPEIIFLPQLAAYFNVSLDELMGYEPQMTMEDIRELYAKLLKEFETEAFDDVKKHCDEIIKKYFSCFPLLYQIGILLMNYGTTTADDKRAATLLEAKALFVRVKTLSDNIDLKQLALQSEAICEIMLGNSKDVVALLENERRYVFHPSIGVMLSQSYQELGKVQEAKIVMQDIILDSVISIFFDIAPYLAICADDEELFEETCKRTMELAQIFKINELFPVAILPFYLAAAEGYVTIGNQDKALTMLETYTQIASDDIFPVVVKGDSFFTLIDELQNKQMQEYPFKMPEPPRDKQTIKQNLLDSVILNPIFSGLADMPRYKKTVENLKIKLTM